MCEPCAKDCHAKDMEAMVLQVDDLRKRYSSMDLRCLELIGELDIAKRLLDEVRESLRELVHGVEDCWNHSGRCLIGTDLQTPETKCECGAWDLIEEPLALLARVRPTSERPVGPSRYFCNKCGFSGTDAELSKDGHLRHTRPGSSGLCGYSAVELPTTEKRNDEKPPMPVCDKCGGGYGVTHPLFNKDSQYKRLCHKCDR